MSITIKNYEAKFKKVLNPKIGLVALSTDQTIESDFNSICKNYKVTIIDKFTKKNLQGIKIKNYKLVTAVPSSKKSIVNGATIVVKHLSSVV